MRSAGKSVISHSFLNIPVKLHVVSSESKSVQFSFINPETNNRIRQQYVDAETNEVVERSSLVKGYEVAKNHHVIFTKEEIKKINEHFEGRIRIKCYVNRNQLDPLYFKRAYFLSADRLSIKSYKVLTQALTDLDKVAVCYITRRNREHLAFLIPYDDILVLQTISYAEKSRYLDEVELPTTEYSDDELILAKKFVNMTSRDEFNHAEFKDEGSEKLLDLINKKILDEDIPEVESHVNTHDLIQSLMESLKEQLAEKEQINE